MYHKETGTLLVLSQLSSTTSDNCTYTRKPSSEWVVNIFF